jgi:hypothetical protein
MKAAITGILLLLCSSLFAQNGYSIKGSVADTATKAKLVNALITVLNSKDSTLVKFGRAATDGSYSINSLTKGKYILLVTYPAYADYVTKFELDSVNRVHNFNQINLTLKAKLLEEIVINGTAAIAIKGDTTVFSTSNLKIQPNSNVEDLLKQLPGIQVDQNGKITAQGQAVEKVLVDGEEFFGDDPTLVTKNLRGDMVKNVQLYDKKSDQAAFTGIDDGQKTKTLNIQLKDGSKNGYFGHVDAGQTANNYYQGQGMFNQFKAKKKFAAYGTIGNTGKTGLGFQDAGKYGIGNSNVQVTDGGVYITGGGDDLESFNGRYDGRGIPLARSGGAHFDSKWNKDKESINTNYKIGSLSVDGTQNTLTQNNLPNGTINTNDDQSYNKYIFRQKLDATYEVKLSSTATLKIMADGTLKNTENNTNNSTFKQRGDNTDLNKSDRLLSNAGDQKIMNASAFWTQKLKKTGRTFSLNLSEALNTNNTKGFLNSTNTFYEITGIKVDSIQHIDQYKTNVGKSSVLSSNMTWSEPFSKTFSLILNYGLTLRNETAEKLSFNQSAPGKYDQLDQQFSNNFKLDQSSHLAGAIFNYTQKKTIVNFGSRISAVSYNQTDLDNNIEYKRNYFNWSPQARYEYRFSQQGAFNVNYNGNTTQPRIDQIQPVRVNDDPLNITIGNADLKPSFRNSLNLNYYSYKVLTSQNIGVGANYSLTSNPIVSNRMTDAAGKTLLQTVNITDRSPYSYSLYSYFSRKLKKSELYLGLDIGMNGSNSYNYINSTLNESLSSGYNASASISKNVLKKYSFRLSGGPRYSINKSSLQPQLNYNNWGLSSNAFFTIYLPGKVEITSDARYTYTQNTATFSQSINPFIWNSSISKKFFKKENLKFSISGSDLLNQNVGFSRSAYTQNSYTTIQRYLMGSLTWDFTKMGGAATAQK